MRNWGQFMRLYQTVSQVTGSYTQALQINDPDVIDAMCEIRMEDDGKPHPPRWWRFTDEMHRLTDIADQLIASRAHGEGVKFYPRPINPAAKERKRRMERVQDDKIEQARRANMERRGLKN